MPAPPDSELGREPPYHDPWIALRRQCGLVLAPGSFVGVMLFPFAELSAPAHRLAAVMAAVIVLWVTEALPMPVTALVGAVSCVLLQVAPAKEVFLPFADPLIFLFIGAFILARAVFFHHLDRRLAYSILSLPFVGGSPVRILAAFGVVTAFISAWVANAATTAMMYAIAIAIINSLCPSPQTAGSRNNRGPGNGRAFAVGLLLMTTFAASVGGLATPVGAAPNLIGLGFIRNRLARDFSFLDFCAVGAPAAAVLLVFVVMYLALVFRDGVDAIPGGRDWFRAQRANLGPWTWGQRSTLVACSLTLTLWLLPALLAALLGPHSAAFQYVDDCLPEPVAALAGAVLLFLLPGRPGERAITWEEAARIDWGIILLFGGGLTLGVLAFQTGLAEVLGQRLAQAIPTHSTLALVGLATVTAALVSEITSNTASANIVVPVVIVIAEAAGVDPLEPALAATFGSGLGFMLPVSTPCNAIVYSSGRVPLRTMMTYGLLLDVVGVAVIVAAVHLIVPLVAPP
jgi:solute carrier family 13 (sodium-dependent dicarboxylate transporter), member 2/3/5